MFPLGYAGGRLFLPNLGAAKQGDPDTPSRFSDQPTFVSVVSGFRAAAMVDQAGDGNRGHASTIVLVMAACGCSSS